MTPAPRTRRGVSLVELMVSLMIMGVLISFSAPSFTRAIEQSKADIAGGNLRSVWSAQRLYRLDNPTYAANLGLLVSAGLLEANFPNNPGSSSPPYTFQVDASGTQTFTISATRSGGTWAGEFTIDQTGTIAGTINRAGEKAISPSFQ